MKLLLKPQESFFEEMTEEQSLRRIREGETQKKLLLALKTVLLFLTALLTAFLLSVITAK